MLNELATALPELRLDPDLAPYFHPGAPTVLGIPLVVDETMADGDAQIRFPI